MSNNIPTNTFPPNTGLRESYSPFGVASSPGNMNLSDYKLRTLRPDIYGIGGTFKRMLNKVGIGFSPRDMIEATLKGGDTQPAMVISLRPLLVSVYSDEFDAVVILDVPEAISQLYKFKLGTRLLACCLYAQDERMQNDIVVGPNYTKRWQILMPVIADLVSGDYAQIRQLKLKIAEDDWHKAWYMGLAYRKQRPGWVRFGLPGLSMVEAMPPANAHEAAKSIYDRS